MGYRCTIQITDDATGEVIERDWFTITDATERSGDWERLNIHGGQMLRNWRDFARAEHERKAEAVS